MQGSVWDPEIGAYRYYEVKGDVEAVSIKRPSMLGWPVDSALPYLPQLSFPIGFGTVPRGTLFQKPRVDLSLLWVTLVLGGLIWYGNRTKKHATVPDFEPGL